MAYKSDCSKVFRFSKIVCIDSYSHDKLRLLTFRGYQDERRS